jgi:hypothetical protein
MVDRARGNLLHEGVPCSIDADDRDIELDHRCYTTKLDKPYRDGSEFVRVFCDREGPSTLVHRVILSRMLGRELTRGDMVRHIDGCGTNNQRSNLDLLTVSESNQNSAVSKSNTSGAKGVAWAKTNKAWRAYATRGGVHFHLGFYPTIEEASAARKDWEQKQQ